MKKELERKLRGPLSDEQWKIFKKLCKKNCIDLDEYAASRLTGDFLFARYWFEAGWEADKSNGAIK